jgi:hypothetical protein
MSRKDSNELRPEDFGARSDALDPLPSDGTAWENWQNWYARAIAAGVHEDVAAVGRAVIWRIYDDHGENQWHETVLRLAGFDDAGLDMIRLALARPQTAVHIWWRIFETRGLRGGPTRAGWAWWNPKRRNRERDAVFATLLRRDAH